METRPRVFGILAEGSHRHKPLKSDSRARLDNVLDSRLDFFWLHAALRLLTRDVDFKKDMRRRTDLVGNEVDPVGKLYRIDGMDEVEYLKRVANLVRLKMTNQVPRWPRYTRRLFPRRLLHLVFTNDCKPRVPRFLHDLRAVSLGDGDDFDFAGVASDTSTRRGDFAADAINDLR